MSESHCTKHNWYQSRIPLGTGCPYCCIAALEAENEELKAQLHADNTGYDRFELGKKRGKREAAEEIVELIGDYQRTCFCEAESGYICDFCKDTDAIIAAINEYLKEG